MLRQVLVVLSGNSTNGIQSNLPITRGKVGPSRAPYTWPYTTLHYPVAPYTRPTLALNHPVAPYTTLNHHVGKQDSSTGGVD